MSEPVRRFEDLIAWQKARLLTAAIYRLCRSAGLARDFGLKDQLQRSAVSVMSNIAEGYERASPNENLSFLRIAKASCAELRSQLYVALDAGYVPEAEFGTLMAQAEEVGRLIGGLRAAVERYRDAR